MDSGNSGSLQSSSGGDEEYDSRAAADSVSAFVNGGSISNPPPSFFDPLSNYLHLHQNPNSSLLGPNPDWSRITSLRSDPNPIANDIVNPNINMLPSSSIFMPSFHPPAAAEADNTSPTTLATPPPQQNQNQTAARNPKKRSRASRRAPTTVLTTDTTNFRAMVQEFTGIPAPPFDSSSFPRIRLDLFGSRSSATSFDAPPYLRRPFAQKVLLPPLPFLTSTSTAATGTSSSSTNNNNNITSVISSNTVTASSSTNPAIDNYQLPITQTSSNLFQNPFLTDLLQTNPKFPFSDSTASKPGSFQISSNDHSRNQFGLSGHGNNFMTSDHQISLQNHRNIDTEKNKDDDDGGGVNLRSLHGDYNFPSTTTNSKMNNNSNLSTSDFHHGGGKRPENNVAGEGEGMVESWICSSE